MAKVRAIQEGYYRGLRQPGDVFEANGLTGDWFEPVADSEPERAEEPTKRARKNPALRGDEKVIDASTVPDPLG